MDKTKLDRIEIIKKDILNYFNKKEKIYNMVLVNIPGLSLGFKVFYLPNKDSRWAETVSFEVAREFDEYAKKRYPDLFGDYENCYINFRPNITKEVLELPEEAFKLWIKLN